MTLLTNIALIWWLSWLQGIRALVCTFVTYASFGSETQHLEWSLSVMVMSLAWELLIYAHSPGDILRGSIGSRSFPLKVTLNAQSPERSPKRPEVSCLFKESALVSHSWRPFVRMWGCKFISLQFKLFLEVQTIDRFHPDGKCFKRCLLKQKPSHLCHQNKPLRYI